MKNLFVGIFCVFFSVSGFAIGSQDTSTNTSSSDYLFQENFARNNVTRVVTDSWGDELIVNIGFSAGKRVIYDGTVTLLDNKLPESALAVLDKDELRLLRNSIYAKHGMIFQSNDMRTHFQRFGWYNPRRSNVDVFLTDVDKLNIESIQLFENTIPNLNLNKRDFVGSYIEWYPVPSWTPEIEINANNTIQYYKGGDDNLEGTYTLEDGFLVVLVTRQYVGSFDYFLNKNWRWPNGVTYNDGRVVYKEPIRMVFPVGNPTRLGLEYHPFYDDQSLRRRQIGSVLWFIVPR